MPTTAQTVFRFKQFALTHGPQTLKVTSDSTLFGAWLPIFPQGPILDCGSGTGLLALMVAQRSPNISIHAIEPHSGAYELCKANFNESPWRSRLKVFQYSIEEFASLSTHSGSYSAVIANPPFFINSLERDDTAASSGLNAALHTNANTISVWLKAIYSLLIPNGALYIMLTPNLATNANALAKGLGYHILSNTLVHHSYAHPALRCFLTLQKPADTNNATPLEAYHTLALYLSTGEYTHRVADLLNPYMLKL
jgi:tRNA1Val (adenine37-N6)-methyltransferase